MVMRPTPRKGPLTNGPREVSCPLFLRYLQEQKPVFAHRAAVRAEVEHLYSNGLQRITGDGELRRAVGEAGGPRHTQHPPVRVVDRAVYRASDG